MNKPPSFEEIKKLRDAASALCDQAFNVRADFHSAINWGDLDCVNVEWFMDAEGEHGYNIYIEEASPLAEDLQNFIFDGLVEYAGDGCIRIITEW